MLSVTLYHVRVRDIIRLWQCGLGVGHCWFHWGHNLKAWISLKNTVTTETIVRTITWRRLTQLRVKKKDKKVLLFSDIKSEITACNSRWTHSMKFYGTLICKKMWSKLLLWVTLTQRPHGSFLYTDLNSRVHNFRTSRLIMHEKPSNYPLPVWSVCNS